NLQDSIALLRIINTPARGIGKSTTETLERLSLETGMSLWSCIGEALERRLLPPRACAALVGFKELIDDARAMLAGTFVERGRETAAAERDTGTPEESGQIHRGDAETRSQEEDSGAQPPGSPDRADFARDGVEVPLAAVEGDNTAFNTEGLG